MFFSQYWTIYMVLEKNKKGVICKVWEITIYLMKISQNPSTSLSCILGFEIFVTHIFMKIPNKNP